MNSDLSRLEISLRQRAHLTFDNGSFQSERNYVDLVVDGQSLAESAKNAGYDLVSVYAKEWVASERGRSHRRLLLEEPADFPNNRRSLLVCGECGDLGCGAVSILIYSDGNSMVWRDFGYENDYENQVDLEKLKHLGPFRFDLTDYRSALVKALMLLEEAR